MIFIFSPLRGIQSLGERVNTNYIKGMFQLFAVKLVYWLGWHLDEAVNSSSPNPFQTIMSRAKDEISVLIGLTSWRSSEFKQPKSFPNHHVSGQGCSVAIRVNEKACLQSPHGIAESDHGAEYARLFDIVFWNVPQNCPLSTVTIFSHMMLLNFIILSIYTSQLFIELLQ